MGPCLWKRKDALEHRQGLPLPTARQRPEKSQRTGGEETQGGNRKEGVEEEGREDGLGGSLTVDPELWSECCQEGLPWWLRWQSVCLQCRRPEFDPWVGKIPWRKWQPTPVLLPGKSHGRRSLVGSPWGSQRVGHDRATSLCQEGLPRAWQPTTVSLPGESHGQRSLAGSIGSQRVRHNWSDLAGMLPREQGF